MHLAMIVTTLPYSQIRRSEDAPGQWQSYNECMMCHEQAVTSALRCIGNSVTENLRYKDVTCCVASYEPITLYK